MTCKWMKDKISLSQLTILIVSTIASIRTLPTTAFFGSSLVFFYVLSAFLFLIPVAFISAEFSSRYPDEGGVFHWIGRAYGKKLGMLAVWLQWINTMVWYPTMLLFIGGTASYLINPALATNSVFLLTVSLLTFWGLTFLNLNGIRSSVRLNSFCGIAGTFIPLFVLLCLGIGWILASNPTEISCGWKDLIPSFGTMDGTNALITIMASFVGMELAGVHIGDVVDPKKNFPKATAYSVLALLGTFIFGSLVIALVVPNKEIHFVDGVMQTFTAFLTAFNLPYFIPWLALLIILGAVGGSVNWVLSPAKGLLQAAEEGFLPNYFVEKNKKGVAYRILVLQAIAVSLFCYALFFVSNVNDYYWFLMALSTGLYMLMYILLFLAALKLGRPEGDGVIPRGVRGILCGLGLFSCLVTMILGFQPAPGIIIESQTSYIFTIAAGFLLLLFPVWFCWKWREKKGERVSTQ